MMVDLHDSLRPTGAVHPLPVSEIANRGKRRKRRRLASTTGLAVATMGIAAFAISGLAGAPADSVTMADGTFVDSTAPTTSDSPPASEIDETTSSTEDTEQPTPSTTPSTSSTDTSTSAASSTSIDAGAETRPMSTPGIRISTTRTSEWEDGYCIQVEVSNNDVDRNDWQVVLDVDGTIATLWNATVVEASAGVFVFSGEDGYNDSMQPGTVTSFGTCVDTDAS